MTDQQKQVEHAPLPQATPEELKRLAQAEKLDELDFLRVRLLNKNIEALELQIALSQSRMREAYGVMQEFGANLVSRYNLTDVAQVEPSNGVITRSITPPPTTDDADG